MNENLTSPTRHRRSLPLRIGRAIWLAASTIVAAASVVSAWGGTVNPTVTTIPALMAMAFPVIIFFTFVAGIINWIWLRRWAWVQIIAIAASAGAIWHYCPLNIFHPKLDDTNSERQLKLLSYNTFQFEDAEGIYPYRTNRTATEIIGSGADVVCVQEVGKLIDLPFRHLTRLQIDSLNSIYPYSAQQETKLVAILSKLPMREIDLEQPESPYAGWAAGEIAVGGDTTLIVSVHLQSIGLNDHDKAIYQEMTDVSADAPWLSASKVFYRKLSAAFRERALQSRMLRQQIDSLAYRNVIVAGDFNDIAECYAARTISGSDMKSALARAGFGPLITYHSDRFYFDIDHIFYKGVMKAASLRRGSIKSSDHYPVYVTFLFPEKED